MHVRSCRGVLPREASAFSLARLSPPQSKWRRQPLREEAHDYIAFSWNRTPGDMEMFPFFYLGSIMVTVLVMGVAVQDLISAGTADSNDRGRESDALPR